MGYIDDLGKIFNLNLQLDEPMNKHTTIGAGGNARYFCSPFSLKAVKDAIITSKEFNVGYKLIGNGSNILVSDRGYNGLIISTKNLNTVCINENFVTAMCGATINSVIYSAFDKGLIGLERLINIPATIGGGIIQNAGAYGLNISDNLTSVLTLEGDRILRIDKNDCGFSYRDSRLKREKKIVVSATFLLRNNTEKIDERLFLSIIKKRQNSQPKGKSFGSVFRNPEKIPAGKLIEDAGLKGYSVGKAKISMLHGNFIINEGNSSSDIFNLIKEIKKKIFYKYKVLLKEEVEYLGEF